MVNLITRLSSIFKKQVDGGLLFLVLKLNLFFLIYPRFKFKPKCRRTKFFKGSIYLFLNTTVVRFKRDFSKDSGEGFMYFLRYSS